MEGGAVIFNMTGPGISGGNLTVTTPGAGITVTAARDGKTKTRASGADGTAVPCGAGGFYVVERIDENHVTILMTADGDLGIRMAEDLNKRQWKLGWVTREDIDAMLAGTYEGVEDENPEEFDGVLFAVQP